MNKLQHKRKMRRLRKEERRLKKFMAFQERELVCTVEAHLDEWKDAIWARTLIDHAKANNSHWLNDRGMFG